MHKRMFGSMRFRDEAGDDGSEGGTGGGDDIEARARALAAEIVEREVAGLKSKNAQLLGEVKKYKSVAAKMPEDFDPERWEQLTKAEQEAAERAAKAEGNFEKLKAQLVEGFDKEKGKLSSERDFFKSAFVDEKVGGAVERAISKADGIADLLRPHVRERVKLEQGDDGKFELVVIDGEGTPRVKGKGEAFTLDDLLAEMKDSDTYAPAFRGSRASGGGASGSAGAGGNRMANPWKADTLNLTEQARMIRENPALAARLKSEAGKK